MKAKRYRKLAYAELNKLFAGSGKGYILKGALTATPNWDKLGSYQEAWDKMREALANMPYNKGIELPRK